MLTFCLYCIDVILTFFKWILLQSSTIAYMHVAPYENFKTSFEVLGGQKEYSGVMQDSGKKLHSLTDSQGSPYVMFKCGGPTCACTRDMYH